MLCKHLSNLCRNASKTRCKQLNLQKTIKTIEESIEAAAFSDNNIRKEAIKKAQKLLLKANINNNTSDNLKTAKDKMRSLEEKLLRLENNSLCLFNLLDGRVLRGIDQKRIIQDIATRIIGNFGEHVSTVDLVKSVVVPYLRRDIDISRL